MTGSAFIISQINSWAINIRIVLFQSQRTLKKTHFSLPIFSPFGEMCVCRGGKVYLRY